MLTSEVSDTAKFVLLLISIDDKVANEPNPKLSLASLIELTSSKFCAGLKKLLCNWVEPDITPVPPNSVSSVILLPNDTDVPLIVIAELDNFELPIEPANLPAAIEPASWEFVIVPLRLEVKYPVASAKLKAGVESDEPKFTDTPPNDTDLLEILEPSIWAEPLTTPVPPNNVWSVILLPKETDVPLIVIELFTNSAFATPPSLIVTAPLETEKLSELKDAIPLLDVDASSPDISPLLISIPSPAENLPLTSEVDNWVFVSVEAIVTAPPVSVIVTLEPAVNAKVSPLAKVLPPAVTLLTAVIYEPVAELRDSLETAVLAKADTTLSVENEPPSEVDVPIIVIAEFASLPFAIEPANWELAIFVICDEPDTTPPISSAESVSPLNIIFTSDVSDTAKFVSSPISIVFLVISCPLIVI